MSTYIFTSRIVLNNSPWRIPATPDFDVHPWIAERVAGSGYYVNPVRPAMRSVEKGPKFELIPIGQTQAGKIFRGDHVWFSFAVSFVFGANNWYPDITAIEFVRFGPEHTDPTTRLGYNPTREELEGRRPLELGNVQIVPFTEEILRNSVESNHQGEVDSARGG